MAQEGNPLSRWSRLKHEQRRLEQEKLEQQRLQREQAPTPGAAAEAAPLPPIETLTPESDFTGFMRPKVQDSVRRLALKKLFADPHFNIPDAFEPFSGDWTGGDPIPPEMMKTLYQARTHLFSDEERKTFDAKEEEEERARLAEASTQTEPVQADEAAAAQPEVEPAEAEAATQEAKAKPDEPGRQDT